VSLFVYVQVGLTLAAAIISFNVINFNFKLIEKSEKHICQIITLVSRTFLFNSKVFTDLENAWINFVCNLIKLENTSYT
jgi:hypothetical protein